MRNFNYAQEADRLLTHCSANQVAMLQGFFGQKKLLSLMAPTALDTMMDNALLQAVSEGCRSSGIRIGFERVRELVHHTAAPRNQTEDMVFRYAQTLCLISDNGFSHQNMMEDIIGLCNHFTYGSVEGKQPQWRTHNKSHIRLLLKQGAGEEESFSLPPPEQAPKMLEAICREYSSVIEKGEINPLFIMPVFITDFAAIQPFDQQYYEINRLLLFYLMHWAGYDILGGIALSLLLKRGIYLSIADNLRGWSENKNNYQYVFDLWMEFSTDAYEFFSHLVGFLAGRHTSTPQIVLSILSFYKERMTKKRIMEYAPHLGESSVELALYTLKNQGLIKMIGRGRYSEYIVAGLNA